MEVAEGVTPPTNSEGDEVTGSEDTDQGGSGGSGGGSGGGQEDKPVSGILGVRPVDQEGSLDELPAVTAQASQADGFVQIAALCGFQDEFHFSKMFRKYRGESPRSYRTRLCIK